MEPHCVIVYAEGLLLGVLVESLLAREPDLQVIKIQAGNPRRLFNAIASYRPDALILDQCTQKIDLHRITGLWADYPDMRVIMVSADDNWLQVYHRTDVLLTDASELIQMIRHT